MFGKLGSAVLAAGTNTTAYTAPPTCLYAYIGIDIVNYDTGDVTLTAWITTTPGSPLDADLIEKGTTIPLGGGVFDRSGILLSPGESLVVKVSGSNNTVRISGKEMLTP